MEDLSCLRSCLLDSPFIIFISFNAYGQSNKDEEKKKRLSAITAFIQKYNKELGIRVSGNYNNLNSLYLFYSKNYSSNSENIVKEFINDEKELPGINSFNQDLLSARSFRQSDNIEGIVYQQVYKGVIVKDAGYLFLVKNNKIIHVSGDYYPEIDIKTNPKITASAIREQIKTEFSHQTIFETGDPKLSIVVIEIDEDYEFKLVYSVRCITDQGDYTLSFDANNGTLESKYSESYYSNGSVYNVTPNQGSLTTKSLPNLLGTGKLESSQFIVKDGADGSYAPPDGSGNFIYSSSSQYVSHVNAYWNCEDMKSYLNGLGISQPYTMRNFKIHTNAPPHVDFIYAAVDFGWTQYKTTIMYLFDTDFEMQNRNAGLDGPVIRHEFSHIFLRAYYPDYVSNPNPYPFKGDQYSEKLAVMESHCDYFAVASRAQYGISIIGDYLDDPSQAWVLWRNHDNNYVYRDYNTINVFGGLVGGKTNAWDRCQILTGAL